MCFCVCLVGVHVVEPGPKEKLTPEWVKAKLRPVLEACAKVRLVSALVHNMGGRQMHHD